MAEREVQPSDEFHRWLTAARRGDHRAFGELVKLTSDEVYTLALRLTRDPEVAADVAQEAYVRAWRALPKFRGDAAFTTWLHRITVNAAWTQRRKNQRHRAASLDEISTEPEAEGMSPERAGLSAGMAPQLDRALSSLPDEQRAVVVLKDVYGWSHAEVAEHLGITVTAAKVRLHRGHKKLRGMLWND